MISWSDTPTAPPNRTPSHGSRDAVETAIDLSKDRRPQWETVITKREPRKYGVRPNREGTRRRKKD
jgi:hypothetical protein